MSVRTVVKMVCVCVCVVQGAGVPTLWVGEAVRDPHVSGASLSAPTTAAWHCQFPAYNGARPCAVYS